MSKKNSLETKGTIFLILFLVVLLIFTAFIIVKSIVVSKDNISKISSKYETIMEFDYEKNYPTNPDDVMDNYCYIVSYLYSDEITDEEIPSVVEKIRGLLHFRTIESISLEQQIQEVRNERDSIADSDSYVTNATHSNVIIDTQFPNYADCSVTQYTKSGNNLLGDYVLQMENYQWKIYSWSLKGISYNESK